MVVKTVTVTADAYDRLRAQKGPGESFSEVIVRLTSRRALASFSGVLSSDAATRLRFEVEAERRSRSPKDAEEWEKLAARH